MRRWLLTLPLVLVLLAPPAVAQRRGAAPVLHEPIPPDAREDVALAVSLDGDIPAAINTPRGLVQAPDPAKPVGTGDSPYNHPPGDARDTSFHPDRDTRRPDVLPYDDPFSPSTAPFKRLSAFDTVDAAYTLSVRDGHTVPLPVAPTPAPDASEEQFYADLVVDLVAGQKIRVPSVGPGARVLRARAGVGTQDVRFQLWKDGAENWFIEAEATVRARIVMEMSIPRMAFGGDFGNPSWAELLPVTPPLPPSVQRAANEVAAKIGVSRRLSPRDDVTKLVSYFRGFTESEDPPSSTRDIYLDLALSRKGVCRHRAFAFMVTALNLGLPTRMIVNEAHAWVEVHDGRLWRRIDLGGAGRTLHDPLSTNVPHDPPPDPFSWPQGATRGDDLAERARHASASGPNATPATSASAGTAPPPAASSSAASASSAGSSGGAGASSGATGFGSSNGKAGKNGPQSVDERAPSILTMTLVGSDAHRGAPFKIRGTVAADGEPCGHVAVEIVLHSRAQGDLAIGQLATDERGAYDGAIVLPAAVPLGEYDMQARTLGDSRCGVGFSR
ncbi:MAG TPA: transglutaminase-like domain-containing protein [Labilithrix sp.]|nr:transglutaminase-like domain-containing protein [Labilithrix sp.]